MDQLLNMNAVQRLGVGIALRAGKTNLAEIRAAVNALLEQPPYVQAAGRVRLSVLQHDSKRNLREFVAEILQYSEGSQSA
jgi:UDP:flavonoid glycosyltransferase YjiC (YdhE family)